MAPRKGVRYRIKTYPSGRRVRQAIVNGRVVETKTIHNKQTKTRKRLSLAKRRIGLR